MGLKRTWLGTALLCGSLCIGIGCGDDDTGTTADGGSKDAGPGTRDAATSDAGSEALLEAPEAKMVGSLELDEPISDVVYAEDLALGLHEKSGVSILDLSDAKKPKVISVLETTGPAVAVSLDPELRILFVLSASGDLRAYRVADVSGPTQIAQSTISEPGAKGDTLQSMVRIGGRLYLLGKSRLLPVSILFGANDNVSFLAEKDLAIEGEPRLIAAGGNVLYIGLAGGKVQVWSSGDKPAMIDQQSLGSDIVNWVVRGHRILAGLRGTGLRVVDLSQKGKLNVVFDAPAFDDLTGLKRFGNLVLASLTRGKLVALDLSDFSAPRALVTRSGTLPKWIAPVGGNLVLGGGKQLSVFGVPPFVSATLPKLSLAALPRYARIPLQLSKPVDPKTVTIANVQLSCGGKTVAGSVVVSLDNLHITFLPKDTLPAGVECKLTLGGVKDALGLSLSAVPTALSFSTMSAAPAPIENPHSAYKHSADGAFSDWKEGKKDNFEYFDVTGARGMYSYFYADFDGKQLWLLNDWFYNGDDIEPDCYNQFGVWTGNGSQSWDIRAYGDQHIEVRLNGELLGKDDARVTGGYSHAATPNDPDVHTVYEIAVTTAPGTWGVQLHDPGPTFSCHQLETDPTNYNGQSTKAMSTIDPTQAPQAPVKPVPGAGAVDPTVPTLTWSSGDRQTPDQFTSYVFELSTGDNLNNVIYRVTVYGNSLVLPAGLLQPGMTYSWRVTAYNLAGTQSSDPVTFTYGETQSIGAPMLSSVSPTSVDQDKSKTLTLTGSGFVEGARAYFDGHELATTFVSSTKLMATLPKSLTGNAGGHPLLVRNVPDNAATASNLIKFIVNQVNVESDVDAGSGTGDVTLVSLDPSAITSTTTNVTVNLTNAGSQGYYLVLTPSGGGDALEQIFCNFTGNDQCSASVNVIPGTYDATVLVGDGAGQYETNALQQALVVSKPVQTACAHDECLSGNRLTATCSSCATAICAAQATAYCCMTGWDSACVDAALASQSCSCPAPGLGSVTPATGAEGATTVVTADLTGTSPSGSYTLVLTPNGGGAETTFPCQFSAPTVSCTASVMGLAIGSYDVKVRAGSQATTYDTNAIANAFAVVQGQ